ncbi:putative pectinesterase/pectinesterase inhibitor 28 [Gastrolobium bilobum]|uniref:putative pectinesterase/pectinesterase inhibitor 28 n=1 Tax=Gastrolobium bilobum TaxID=150636 RepID=UPI002AB16D64|nr:putative pectinesterase/pectinesterase inhibitor 28 [Gastrolobium bilobum]
MNGADAHKRKRIVIISVSTFLLVAMVVAVTVGVNFTSNGSNDDDQKNNEKKNHVYSTVKAVKTLCQPTDYKKECEESLKAEAGNTTDPRELIKIAFNATITKISNGLKKTDLLHEVEKEPRAKMALDTCKQLMDLSIEEFTRSLERMGNFDLNNLDNILTSLKVWLSGAVTYQETCLDGFDNTTSEAGKKMKNILTSTMHMSSNALAIISELAKTVSEMNLTRSDGRRLIQDSVDDQQVLDHDEIELIPSWADNDGAGVRRLLHTSPRKLKAHVVVAKDGSGKFKTINKALKLVPKKNKKPFVIYIKEGVYHEYVEVTREMTHVVFVGDGRRKTRITGKKNFIDGFNTYRTPTVAIQGDYFVAINMGFENSAGPHKHQAVAIRVQADKSIFYKCAMDGYQDTLYVHAMRQFYRECTISGTIDFIFGDAVAVFQNCTFVVRKPMQNQQCIVTAQGRKERHEPTGIVIQGGSIVSNRGVKFDSKAYLARPWKNYSRTIFMDTYIEDLIQQDGYMPWQGPEGLSGTDTCFYAEYNNTGPGSNKSKRVKWPGIKALTSKSARGFLPSTFFNGDDWIKVTRIPYSSGEASPKH